MIRRLGGASPLNLEALTGHSPASEASLRPYNHVPLQNTLCRSSPRHENPAGEAEPGSEHGACPPASWPDACPSAATASPASRPAPLAHSPGHATQEPVPRPARPGGPARKASASGRLKSEQRWNHATAGSDRQPINAGRPLTTKERTRRRRVNSGQGFTRYLVQQSGRPPLRRFLRPVPCRKCLPGCALHAWSNRAQRRLER